MVWGACWIAAGRAAYTLTGLPRSIWTRRQQVAGLRSAALRQAIQRPRMLRGYRPAFSRRLVAKRRRAPIE